MQIKNAKFIISVSDSGKLPCYDKPEIAIAGKSNVGKSSFINFICNNSKLARTSSEPGRTRLLNYFEINGGEFYIVDMPGYGYARVSKEEKAGWGALAEGYLKNSKELKCVVLLVDIRHDPNPDDRLLLNFMHASNIPFAVVATKGDKLSRQQSFNRRAEIAACLNIGRDDVLTVSSLKKTGLEEILNLFQTRVHLDVGE
ncbi:MAG: ribosome biogenesis GTP-binding protein YihA/YsxC [Clostridiaceae bacterium]|jgi:GTP-binding protein|nr:ribosome biogenesis GTP-binding protein YihA/YsxC [Clostridiaceae bacterium]